MPWESGDGCNLSSKALAVLDPLSSTLGHIPRAATTSWHDVTRKGSFTIQYFEVVTGSEGLPGQGRQRVGRCRYLGEWYVKEEPYPEQRDKAVHGAWLVCAVYAIFAVACGFIFSYHSFRAPGGLCPSPVNLAQQDASAEKAFVRNEVSGSGSCWLPGHAPTSSLTKRR